MITLTLEMTEAEAALLIEDLLMAKDAVQSLGRLMRIERGLVAAETIGALAVRFRAQLDSPVFDPVVNGPESIEGFKIGDQVAWRHNGRPAGVVEAVGRDAGTGLACLRTDQVGWKLASLFWRFG